MRSLALLFVGLIVVGHAWSAPARGLVKDVNVANTPSVNVANNPNVNVTNVPSVNVNNSSLDVNVTNSGFEISNDADSPVPVMIVEDSSGEPAIPITLATPLGMSNILAWSWGASNSGGFGGGGGGAGRVSFSEVSINKYLDAMSAEFLRLVATGDHLEYAVIVQGPTEIRFEQVLVTSYSVGGSADGGVPIESLSLNFGRVLFRVDKGEACWDVANNKSC